MGKQSPQNEEVLRIGSKLLNAARLTDAEIDNIVAAPHLFGSIQNSIQTATRSVATTPTRGFGLNLRFGLRPAFASAGILLLLLLAGLAVTRPWNEHQPGVTVSLPGTAQRSRPAGGVASGSFAETVKFVRTPRTAKTQLVRKASAPASPRMATQPEKEPAMGEFHTIAYTGEPAGEGGRLVRVELPRTSLLAMGIEVPAGNVAAWIKTDLLIGPDGVMTAVRVAQD